MTRQELEKKTIASLRSLAKEHSIRLRTTLKKKEIVDLLLSHLQKNKKKMMDAPVRKSRKKKVDPTPPGHAGEGELHDEKVIFAPSAAIDRPSAAPLPGIPKEYGVNQAVLLVRDPWWIYVYWEVTPEGLGEANRRTADPEARLTLRIYDLTERQDLSHFWDIEVYQRIGNWYVDAGRPDRAYLADIGMKSRAGEFATVARSNVGRTPPDGPSTRFDEEWWTVQEDEEVAAAPYDDGRRLPFDRMEESVREALASIDRFSPGLLKRESD